MKDLMNWMIWMTTFNMELRPLHIKINQLLTVTKKMVLVMIISVAKQIYQNT